MIDHDDWVSYQKRGFTEETRFEGEYLLLINPRTMMAVRLYENGQVWEKDENGLYVRVK